jgi:hypothetical protein
MIEKRKKTSDLEVDLNQLVFNMIQELPERSRNIIVKRFDLDHKGIRTLDKIGRDYGLTRERVRQIETESISRLKDIGRKHNLQRVLDHIERIIESHGGVMSKEKIVEHLFDIKGVVAANKQVILLILSLDDRIKEAKETITYKKLYFYKKENVIRTVEAMNRVENYLRENKKSISFDKIVELFNSGNEGSASFSLRAIKSCLEANKIILENVLGQWGCKDWPNINPQSVRDKAYLVLKKSKNKNPLHFTEITNRVNEVWVGKRKANKQTVHNELIKDKRFVLVGRGIYALREWGYEPGTVLDVIREVLKKRGSEVEQDDIIEEVLKKRQVRKNTIMLNLHNKKYFEKLAGRVYKLK